MGPARPWKNAQVQMHTSAAPKYLARPMSASAQTDAAAGVLPNAGIAVALRAGLALAKTHSAERSYQQPAM
jgi:hypothetical protein